MSGVAVYKAPRKPFVSYFTCRTISVSLTVRHQQISNQLKSNEMPRLAIAYCSDSELACLQQVLGARHYDDSLMKL